jgi:hypothetical protein
MTADELTAAVQRGKPFILRTRFGKEYSISLPEQLTLSDDGEYLVVITKHEPPAVVFLEDINEIVFRPS